MIRFPVLKKRSLAVKEKTSRGTNELIYVSVRNRKSFQSRGITESDEEEANEEGAFIVEDNEEDEEICMD